MRAFGEDPIEADKGTEGSTGGLGVLGSTRWNAGQMTGLRWQAIPRFRYISNILPDIDVDIDIETTGGTRPQDRAFGT